MPPRSNVIVTFPAHLRAEVERRMAESGFSDYRGLAEWVRQQGYEISDDSLWRYGKGIQRQLAAAQMAVHQARALTEATRDGGVLLIEVIMTVVEQKVLSKLIEGEQIENSDIRLLNAAANLARATVFHQRRADEVQAREKEQKAPRERGLSEETYNAIRNTLLGIDPFKQEHATALRRIPQADIESGPYRESDYLPGKPGLPSPQDIDGQTEGPFSDEGTAKPTESQPVEEDRPRTECEATQLKTSQAPSTASNAWSWPKLIISQGKEQSGLRTKPKPDT